MKRFLSAGAVLLSLAALGCAPVHLRRDLKEIEGLAFFTGRIALPEGETGPVLVVLAEADPAAPRLATFDRIERPDDYRLLAAPGSYEILAFLDRDGDFTLGPEEPIGRLLEPRGDGRPQEIRLGEGTGRDAPFAVDLSDKGLAAALPRRSELVGGVFSLDDPRFAPATGSLGLWQPMRFLREVGPAVAFLEPYDPERIPVLFVHGLGGTPQDFRPLIERLDRSRFQPWVFQYPSGLSLHFPAWALGEMLDELRARHGFAWVHVVAHSMGGLVTQTWLLQRARQGDPPLVEDLVTVSTPWLGLPVARLGEATSPAVAPAWRELEPGSPLLRELLGQPLPRGVRHSLIFSFAGNRRLLPGVDDGTVPLESQLPVERQERAVLVRGLAEDHSSILQSEQLHRLLAEVLGKP